MKKKCEHIWLNSPIGDIYCRDCGVLENDVVLYKRVMTQEGYAFEPVRRQEILEILNKC